MNPATETILIVEDEPADIEFLQRAFTKAGITNPVQSVSNGEEAIAYLTGRGAFADRKAFPFPRVVITDLKMPQMDGIQLLQWIRANPEFRVVPTIVLTSSTSQSDVNAAFACGASAYIVKPVEIRELQRIAKVIADYWTMSLLPTRA
jgi:CheY-like chemotaxis protein